MRVRVLATLLVAITSVHADEPRVVGGAGRSLAEVVLVGERGERYRRDGGRWIRAGGGGVAATLVAAEGAPDGTLWAMGASTPPYRLDRAGWFAVALPDGGAGVLAARSGVTAVTAGRRVAVWSQAGSWTELAALPATATATALAATGPRDLLAATDAGQLLRLQGSWKPVAVTLASPSERIVKLVPLPGNTALALGSEGSLLQVDARASRPVKIDPRLGRFAARALAAGAPPVVLGEADVDGRRVVILGGLERGTLVPLDLAVPLAAGDPVTALLALPERTVLVVTPGGVRVRSPAGQWTTEPVDGTAPAPGDHARVPPAEIRRAP